MSEFETTKFVNIDDEDFTAYYNKTKEPNGWTFKVGETREILKPMAEVFANHLIDKVLQKQGVRDTRRDTPLRRSLLAKIIPELPIVNESVKSLTKEEELRLANEQISKELDSVRKFTGEVSKKSEERDKEVTELKKEIEALKKKVSKPTKAKKAKAEEAEVEKAEESLEPKVV